MRGTARRLRSVASCISGEARRFAEAVGGCAVFGLNDDFGAWRVVHHRDRWQADFSPLAGASIEEDLAARGAVPDHVAGDRVLLGHEAGVAGRPHDEPTAREALADVVVGFAD